MFSLFKKKKELRVPVPPSVENLPNFPTPKELEKLSPEEIKKASGAELKLEDHKKLITEKERTGLEKIRSHQATKPLFIHAQTYRNLIDEVGQMKGLMVEAEEIVETLDKFQDSQDRAFKSWQSSIKDIHEKLIYVDETLFKR